MSPIEHLVTSGTFSLDGGTWEVENNVWIVGDEREVMLIDPAHDAEAVAKQVGDRRVTARQPSAFARRPVRRPDPDASR